MTRDGEMERRTGEGVKASEAADAALLGRLASTLAGAQEAPDDVVELARLSFGLRRLDDELAELVADSAIDSAPAGVRASGDGPRLLAFEAGSGELELQVTRVAPGPGAGGWEVIGQVVPAGRAAIRLESADQAKPLVDVDADDLGSFTARIPSGGPWRLVCRRQGLPPLVSQWVLLG